MRKTKIYFLLILLFYSCSISLPDSPFHLKENLDIDVVRNLPLCNSGCDCNGDEYFRRINSDSTVNYCISKEDNKKMIELWKIKFNELDSSSLNDYLLSNDVQIIKKNQSIPNYFQSFICKSNKSGKIFYCSIINDQIPGGKILQVRHNY